MYAPHASICHQLDQRPRSYVDSIKIVQSLARRLIASTHSKKRRRLLIQQSLDEAWDAVQHAEHLTAAFAIQQCFRHGQVATLVEDAGNLVEDSTTLFLQALASTQRSVAAFAIQHAFRHSQIRFVASAMRRRAEHAIFVAAREVQRVSRGHGGRLRMLALRRQIELERLSATVIQSTLSRGVQAKVAFKRMRGAAIVLEREWRRCRHRRKRRALRRRVLHRWNTQRLHALSVAVGDWCVASTCPAAMLTIMDRDVTLTSFCWEDI